MPGLVVIISFGSQSRGTTSDAAPPRRCCRGRLYGDDNVPRVPLGALGSYVVVPIGPVTRGAVDGERGTRSWGSRCLGIVYQL